MIAESVQASAVNARGTVVGLVQDGGLDTVFRYENGEYTELRKPAGRWHPYPYPAINAAGDALINVEPDGNSGGKGSKVLLWRAGSTKPVQAGVNARGWVRERDDRQRADRCGGADPLWPGNMLLDRDATKLSCFSGRLFREEVATMGILVLRP